MKKIHVIIIVFLFGAVGWLVLSNSDVLKVATKKPDQISRVLELSLKDYKGNTVNLSDFIGRPMVINSWAAWCPFCRKELVDFAIVQREFSDRIVIIVVNRAESLDIAKKYSDDLAVTNDLILLLDPSDSFYQSIGGFSMPETIFIDKDGNIVEQKRGPMEIDDIRQKINRLISL